MLQEQASYCVCVWVEGCCRSRQGNSMCVCVCVWLAGLEEGTVHTLPALDSPVSATTEKVGCCASRRTTSSPVYPLAPRTAMRETEPEPLLPAAALADAACRSFDTGCTQTHAQARRGQAPVLGTGERYSKVHFALATAFKNQRKRPFKNKHSSQMQKGFTLKSFRGLSGCGSKQARQSKVPSVAQVRERLGIAKGCIKRTGAATAA